VSIFITTIGFLVYIVFLLSIQNSLAKDTFLFHHALLSHSKKTSEELEDETYKRTIKKYRKIAPLVSKEVKHQRRENLSHKFHIDVLFSQEADLKTDKYKACLLIFKNMVDVIYKNEEFYKEAKTVYPDLPERLCFLLTTGAKQLDDQEIKHESELGKIKIQDEYLRTVFFKMMTGKKMRYASQEQKQIDEHMTYYALYEYVSVASKPYLFCAYQCSDAVLYACFQDQKIVDDILAHRKDMIKQISKASPEEKQALKTKLALEFRTRFESSLPQGINKNLVSFNISGQDRET